MFEDCLLFNNLIKEYENHSLSWHARIKELIPLSLGLLIELALHLLTYTLHRWILREHLVHNWLCVSWLLVLNLLLRRYGLSLHRRHLILLWR